MLTVLGSLNCARSGLVACDVLRIRSALSPRLSYMCRAGTDNMCVKCSY